MKYMPNALTGLRMVLSLCLLLIKPFSPLFLIIYSICGISDILDGLIARKTHSVSAFGSKLDSIADILFMSAVLIALVPKLTIPAGFIIWILLIAAVRIVSLIIVYCKYHTFAILHTYANKITGLLLFCFPYFYTLLNISLTGSILCIAASLSSAEELAIISLSQQLVRDIPGLFSMPKSN